jgi:hypothetical protein
MKKILIAMLLVLAMVCMTVPAMAAKGFYVTGTSSAAVSSISGTTGFGISATCASAWNGSLATVTFPSGNAVSTYANSGGKTFTGGFNGNTLAEMSGSAYATGWKN